MLRWLIRLLVLALIIAAVAFVAGRLMRQEEDFDEYEDIEAGFEFQETPVEIDVPAETGTTTGTAEATRMIGGDNVPQATLTDISGIGPAYEARLQAAGIRSVEDLANADAGSLAEQVEVIGGISTIEDWIAQARDLGSGSSNGRRSS